MTIYTSTAEFVTSDNAAKFSLSFVQLQLH